LPITQMQWHLTSQTLFEGDEFETDWQWLTSYECPYNSYHGKDLKLKLQFKNIWDLMGKIDISNGQWWYGLAPWLLK
jgi:hypothetical protein